jgi:hypothetical protein
MPSKVTQNESVSRVLAAFALAQKQIGATLLNAKPHQAIDGETDAVMLEMCIDLRSAEQAREDTQRLREIADNIDAAMRRR